MFSKFNIVKNEDMKKKDYIFNMTNLICSRVKFQAPKNAENMNFEALINQGIDLTKPVFFYENRLSPVMAKCFYNAQKKLDFNLVFTQSQPHSRKLNFIISDDENLKKLNVNYRSSSNYNPVASENYILFNGKKAKQTLCNYFYDGFLEDNGINCFVRECVLSGRGIYLEFLNTTNSEKSVNFEINLPLEKGYYTFEKLLHAIKITHLFSGERMFFNFSSKANKFCFSCVDGVENCAYPKVNISCNLRLKPYQKQHYFYNFGSEKFMLNSMEEIEAYFAQSKRKTCEIFDVKIDTKFKDINNKINYILPEKIYMAWLKGKSDIKCEKEYLDLRKRFVLKANSGFVLNEYDNINSLKIFNGSIYKEVLVIKNCDEKAIEHLGTKLSKNTKILSISQRDLSSKNVPICIV